MNGLAIDKSDTYALVACVYGEGGGELIAFKNAGTWQLKTGGGGAFSVNDLIADGVPSEIASYLVSNLKPTLPISDLTLTTYTPTITGPCPATITFFVTLTGAPGTIFGNTFVSDGKSVTKQLYGYVPDSGFASFDKDLKIDAAHAGSHAMQVQITVYQRANGGDFVPAGPPIFSDKVNYTISCASPVPSASASP